MQEEIDHIRGKIAGYTDYQLMRLDRRIWAWIDSHYGAGSWDWPTLRVVYPQFACAFKAIAQELLSRGPRNAR